MGYTDFFLFFSLRSYFFPLAGFLFCGTTFLYCLFFLSDVFSILYSFPGEFINQSKSGPHPSSLPLKYSVRHLGSLSVFLARGVFSFFLSCALVRAYKSLPDNAHERCLKESKKQKQGTAFAGCPF